MSKKLRLEVKNLQVSVERHPILKGLNLSIEKGDVHAIMGPNGSGKSTLAYTLAGKSDYVIDGGDINFLGQVYNGDQRR